MDFHSLLALFYLTAGTIILLLGLIIFRENARQQINRITALMLAFAAFGAIMDAFGMLMRPMPGIEALDLTFFQRLFILWEFFFPSLLVFALLFPLPTQSIRNHPGIAFFLFIPHIFHFVLVMVFKSPDQIINLFQLEATGWFSSMIKPLAVLVNFSLYLISLFYEFRASFFALVNLVYIITAVIVMYISYQHLQNMQFKKQVAFLLWGIRASVGLYAIGFLIPRLIPFNIAEDYGRIFSITALLIGAISIAWAIIKYQFLNIRLFLRRGIIFSLATGIVIGLFLIIYDQAERMMNAILEVKLPIIQILFIVLAVILFQPIIAGIEKGLGKVFAPFPTDHRKDLQSLSQDIMTVLDLNQLKQKIETVLKNCLLVQNVFLLLPNEQRIFAPTEASDNGFSFRPEGDFVNLMVATRSPLLFDEARIRLASSPELADLEKLRPFLLLPLFWREQLIGILMLGEREAGTAFSGEDIGLLSMLANQIAIAVENSRLYQEKLEKQHMEKELALAREIQRMLLPLESPVSDHFEITALSIPSREVVGGDYYDYYFEPPDRLGIVIADISGKGIPASLIMANLQAVSQVSARQFKKPSEVVHNVNQHIVRTTSVEKYATFLYGVYHLRSKKFVFTNAGHNYPIWRRHDGSVQVLTQTNLIVGASREARYRDASIKLSTHDFLIFYTDGVTEVMNDQDELYGEQRLLAVVSKFSGTSARALRDLIYDEVKSFSENFKVFDDMTLIILKVK